MSNNLNKLFFEFKEHMKVKNYSPATVQSYSRNLMKFIDYLGEINTTDLKRVTRDILTEYQVKITENKHLQKITINTIPLFPLTAMKSYSYK